MEQWTDLEVCHLDGAGNTFAAMDVRALAPLSPATAALLAQKLCSASGPFGTLDGILLLEAPSSESDADIVMHYRNRDGSRAEMCGNGLRCFAHFAQAVIGLPSQLRIGTDAGPHRAEIHQDANVRVHFPGVIPPPLLDELFLGGRFVADLTRTGVPHLVLWVEDLKGIPFAAMATKLRRTPELEPEGANVNAALRLGANRLRLRTWERGVEGETLACGTGVVAAALCLAAREETTGNAEVFVEVASGVTLSVSFHRDPEGIARSVTLTGPSVLRGRARLRIDPATGRVEASS